MHTLRHLITLALLSLCLFGSSRLAARGEPATDAPPRPGREALPHRPSPVASPAHVAATARLIPWSHLVFQTFRNDNWEIYSSNDDASDQLRLTVSGESDIHPVYNRGATRIAYARKDGDYEIRVMNSDGSGNVTLTDNGTDDVFPAWSPDGAWLAFQAYRDGQAEIYRMRADGTGVQRLTTSADYDGEPAWSPDGSKIAFVARRQGQYRIWVMNADGSGQTQLSNQSYSSNPTWSPDGLRIAYDADGDGDGWQELWVMHADGSNQQMVYRPSGMNTDAWAGSWSPDGRYLAFTNINFIFHDGNWYWTTARLLALDLQSGQWFHLGATDVDWNPDWQTRDTAAPTSGVRALPAESPATVNVAWFGSDVGPAGLKNFDVQIRTGGGAWTGWLTQTTQTSGTFIGIGGQSYFIRARARDWANNVEAWPADHDAATTIEALPPISAVQPLPAFARAPLLVRWSGVDPGSSGVAHFDVQSRTGSTGSWQDWQVRTYATSAEFNGASGQTYYFRARATDLAQNVEIWPEGDGDAQTTLYDWQHSGVVRDNAGAPISGAQLQVNPATLNAATSDVNGYYSAFAVSPTVPYVGSWAKTGYGSLPATMLSTQLESSRNIVLPPQDNVVLNWGFENGIAPWGLAGTLTVVPTTTLPRSGGYAVHLGAAPWALANAEPAPAGADAIIVGPDGTLHVAWAEENNLRYRQRAPDGTWSPLESINPTPAHGGDMPQLHLTEDGSVLMVWRNLIRGAFVATRSPAGQWYTPQNLSPLDTTTYHVTSKLDHAGRLHVIWTSQAGSYYAQRSPTGQWSAPEAVPTGSDDRIAIDHHGNVHRLWWSNFHSDVDYAVRNSVGQWSPARTLSTARAIGDHSIAIDSNNRIHVIWTGFSGIYYMTSAGNGSWTEPALLAAGVWPFMELDAADQLHVIWFEGGKYVVHRQRSPSGAWSVPFKVSVRDHGYMGSESPGHRMAVNRLGQVVITWVTLMPGMRNINFMTRDIEGNWSLPRRLGIVSNTPYTPWPIQSILDDQNNLHVIWNEGGPVFYVGPTRSNSAGQAILQQNLTIPANLNSPRLSFAYQFGSGLASGDNALEVHLAAASGETTLASITTSTAGWTYHSLDLSNWSGQTITLTFRLRQAANTYSAWALIDEVTLGSSYPDVWVTVPSRTARRGEEVRYVIQYGNQGGAPASDVQLTFTLPAEVTFVSATVPPTVTGSTLTWNPGSLAAKTGPYEIVVTGRISATAPIPSTFSHSAQIQCTTSELETLNNTQSVTTTVEPFFVRLPLIVR